MKKCSVDGCEKGAGIDELCWKHFNRKRKYGDPLLGPQNYRHLSDKDRFMKYVEPIKETGCWHFLGAIDGGYGKFRLWKKNFAAHRAALVLFSEPVEGWERLLACHSCDNTICVNPGHLFWGTCQDNVDDKMKKGRHRSQRGETHRNARLTESNVLEIRNSNESSEELGKRFGVRPSNINAIRQGIRWKHVGGRVTKTVGPTRGEAHHVSKLNDGKVRYIRSSDKSSMELALELDVSYYSVYEVRRGETWKHVK